MAQIPNNRQAHAPEDACRLLAVLCGVFWGDDCGWVNPDGSPNTPLIGLCADTRSQAELDDSAILVDGDVVITRCGVRARREGE